MTVSKTLLQRKYTRVIIAFAKLENISLKRSYGSFYNSEICMKMSNDISDMHCRKDGYLAEEIQLDDEKYHYNVKNKP